MSTASNRSGSNWGTEALRGDSGIATYITTKDNRVIAPDFTTDRRAVPTSQSTYTLQGSRNKDKEIIFSLNNVLLDVGEYKLWYGDKLFGIEAEDNNGYSCADIYVLGCPHHTLAERLVSFSKHSKNSSDLYRFFDLPYGLSRALLEPLSPLVPGLQGLVNEIGNRHQKILKGQRIQQLTFSCISSMFHDLI